LDALARHFCMKLLKVGHIESPFLVCRQDFSPMRDGERE
jgi:hypothetical protein